MIHVGKPRVLCKPAREPCVDLLDNDGQFVEAVAVIKKDLPHVAAGRLGIALEQLLAGPYRVSQANPDAAAVGKLTRDMLPKCSSTIRCPTRIVSDISFRWSRL